MNIKLQVCTKLETYGLYREIGFKPSGKIFLPTVPRQYFVCGSFMFFCLVFVMPLCRSVYWYLVVTYLSLVCGVSLKVCHFPIGILGRVWYLIVSIPDLCTLTYFYTNLFLSI